MPTLPDSGVSFTVKTNGQTLIVSAGRDYATLTALLYSDAACTLLVTTPQTITSDTTYYLPPDRAQAAYYISCKTPDGTELWGRSQHLGGITIEPLPSRVQVASDLNRRDLALAPTGALAETWSRTYGVAQNGTSILTSGVMSMFAIYLPAGLTVTSITFQSATQAAVAPTAQWFALYGSDLVLRRQTVDDTSTAWSASSTKTLALSSTYTTTKSGLHYLGINVVAGTVPTLMCSAPLVASTTLAPIIGGTSTTGLTTTAPDPAAALTPIARFAYAYVS